MINVNAATKTAYLSDSKNKQLTISFPDINLTLGNSDFTQGSMEYTESVIADNSIEFVGCIASRFSITVHNVTEDLKGQKIVVSIIANNTQSVPLFTGYVNTVDQVPHKKEKKITAYDILYQLSDVNIAQWYNNLSFPLTLKDFRDSLFQYLGITQEVTTLANDDMGIAHDYNPSRLSARDIIKSVCQINCVFGRITRDGTFEYVNAPNNPEYNETIHYYKKADYQEFRVKPIDRVVIQANAIEVSAGLDAEVTNKYIIRNNFFTLNLNANTLQTLANNLYPVVSGFSYIPFNADVNGLPYIQCLDVIRIPVYPMDASSSTPTLVSFMVLERTMKGIQALRDNYSADGNEYQHEFVTDISVDMEQLKWQVEGIVQKEFTSYELRNLSPISIGDNEQKRLLFARIAANTQTKAQIHIEVNLESEATEDYTQGIVTYLINSEDAEFYPTETWIDGNHVLHLMYILPLEANTLQTFEVYMQSLGGTIEIDRGGVWLYASGAGLVGDGKWDGTIEILDEASEWTFSAYTFESASENVSVLLDFAGEYLSTEDGEELTTEDGEEFILEVD